MTRLSLSLWSQGSAGAYRSLLLAKEGDTWMSSSQVVCSQDRGQTTIRFPIQPLHHRAGPK